MSDNLSHTLIRGILMILIYFLFMILQFGYAEIRNKISNNNFNLLPKLKKFILLSFIGTLAPRFIRKFFKT